MKTPQLPDRYTLTDPPAAMTQDWFLYFDQLRRAGSDGVSAGGKQNTADFKSDNLNVMMFGARGDGQGNDAIALQAAIDATASGQTLLIPCGQYQLSGAGTELLLISKPIRLVAEPGAALLVAASVGSSTDVIRMKAPPGGATDYCLENLVIRPVSGNPARHGINIDCTTDVLYKSLFAGLNIQNLGGCGITVTNPTPLVTGGFFTSTIRDSYFGGLGGSAGIYLNNAGDSIHIKHCTFFGDQLGILADLISGAHGLMILDCNNSALKGFLKILSGDSASIIGGDLEVTGATTSGTAEPAIIHIAGRVGAPVLNTLIDCRYLGVSTIARAIQVDYATNTHIRSVECAVGYGPGTTGSNEMIHMTSHATNTIIGEHVTFSGGAPPSRNYLDESSSTIYPPAVSPQASSSLLRDSNGAGQLTSLVTNQGTFGYFQNAAFKSEEFESASWIKTGATVSVTGTGPDGAASARKLIEDGSTGVHEVYQGQGVTSNAEQWWFAIYCKQSTRTQVRVQIQDLNETKAGQAIFDLTTGSIVSESSFGGATLVTAYSVALASGWYRCVVSVITNSFDNVLATAKLSNAGSTSYAGDGTSGLYLFGASVSKTYPSSYIKTTAALPSVGPSWGLVAYPLTASGTPENRLFGKTTISGTLTTIQGQDTAGTLITILYNEQADDTIRVGWQSASATNGQTIIYGGGSEGMRVNPDQTVTTKKGLYPSYQFATGLFAGTGSPNSVVTAAIGSVYMRIDGAAGAALYVKESGTGNTGWVAYSSGASGALLAANNLSDVASVSGARTNLGVDPSLTVAGWTVALAKITAGGANGSLTVDTHGRITAYTAPT